jgi:hypothetical protein
LYFAPQTQVCVPVSHSTNSVILRICAPTHPLSKCVIMVPLGGA